MPSVITPARLAALVGVLTGIGAVVTSLLGVIPSTGSVGRGLAVAGGAIGTAVTVAKWMEGQAAWEQQQSAQTHERALVEDTHARLYPPTPAKSTFQIDNNLPPGMIVGVPAVEIIEPPAEADVAREIA